MFISFDNGAHWQTFQLNLPITPVTDIRVHRKDLVLSTMGRAFWILDNVTPLHQLTDAVQSASAQLLAPRAAYRTRYVAMGGRPAVPDYPPNGAHLDYVLAADAQGEIKLEILDVAGKVIRTITSNQTAVPLERPSSGGDEETRGAGFGAFAARPLTKKAGLNRYVWDLRYDGGGPLVVPGQYQVRLTVDSKPQTQPLTVRLDPRLAKDGVTLVELQEQLTLNLQIRETLNEARQLVSQIGEKLRGASGETAGRLQALRAKLLTAPGPYPQPMLLDQLQSLSRMVNGADRKVGRSAVEYFQVLKKQLGTLQQELVATP